MIAELANYNSPCECVACEKRAYLSDAVSNRGGQLLPTRNAEANNGEKLVGEGR